MSTDNLDQTAQKELTPKEAEAYGHRFLPEETHESFTDQMNCTAPSMGAVKKVDSVKLSNGMLHPSYNADDFARARRVNASRKSESTDKVTDKIQTDQGGSVRAPMGQAPFRKDQPAGGFRSWPANAGVDEND